MFKPRSLSTDLIKAESSAQIFPLAPLQMSDPTAWHSIFLVHHRQPAWEMPANRLVQHIISINIGAARKLERVIDGRLQQEKFLPGNIAIYPADVDYILRWEKEAEFLLVGIAPELLVQTATAISKTASIDLIPLLSVHDSVIYHLALTLKSELEAPQIGGKLYVEAIAQTLAMHILRNYSTNRATTPIAHGLPQHKLQQVTDYINNFLERDLSLAELAALVQISPLVNVSSSRTIFIRLKAGGLLHPDILKIGCWDFSK